MMLIPFIFALLMLCLGGYGGVAIAVLLLGALAVFFPPAFGFVALLAVIISPLCCIREATPRMRPVFRALQISSISLYLLVGAYDKYARLTRSVGEVRRALHFFYLGIEGITTFFNLFTPVSTAPQAVYLRFSCDPNGPYFCDWGGPFAQLVRRSQVKPSYVLGCGGPGSTWPYPRLWQQIPGWLDMWVSPDYVPEGIQCNPLGGARRVIVKRGTLTPEPVAGIDAVVLSIPLYKKHRERWPGGTRIILLAPASQRGQLPAQNDRVVFLRSKRAPLGRLLDSLAETCKSFTIDRVASVGMGYEDEGPELDAWRRRAGPALELTIYCEHEGDMVSLGPYADEIQQ
jgi:hypothetical protein